jgi:hypothetical protein
MSMLHIASREMHCDTVYGLHGHHGLFFLSFINSCSRIIMLMLACKLEWIILLIPEHEWIIMQVCRYISMYPFNGFMYTIHKQMHGASFRLCWNHRIWYTQAIQQASKVHYFQPFNFWCIHSWSAVACVCMHYCVHDCLPTIIPIIVVCLSDQTHLHLWLPQLLQWHVGSRLWTVGLHCHCIPRSALLGRTNPSIHIYIATYIAVGVKKIKQTNALPTLDGNDNSYINITSYYMVLMTATNEQ